MPNSLTDPVFQHADEMLAREFLRASDGNQSRAIAMLIQRYGKTQDEAIDIFARATKHGGAIDPESWPDVFETRDEFENAPPMKWVITNICQEGEATIIGGLAKHAKTWLMLSKVKALLTGDPWLNHRDFTVAERAARVLYLIPEVGRRSFYKRLKLMGLDGYLGTTLFVRTLSKGSALKLNDPRILRAAEGSHAFIDTVVRHMDGDEDVADAKNFADYVFKLLSVGALSVFGAHHSPKSFEKETYMTLENVLRGSGDLGAMTTNAYGVRQVDEPRNRIYVQCLVGRDLDELVKPFLLEARPWINSEGNFRIVKPPGVCGDLVDELPAKKSKTDKRLEVIETLVTQDPDISQNKIFDELKNRGIGVHRKELKDLIEQVKLGIEQGKLLDCVKGDVR